MLVGAFNVAAQLARRIVVLFAGRLLLAGRPRRGAGSRRAVVRACGCLAEDRGEERGQSLPRRGGAVGIRMIGGRQQRLYFNAGLGDLIEAKRGTRSGAKESQRGLVLVDRPDSWRLGAWSRVVTRSGSARRF